MSCYVYRLPDGKWLRFASHSDFYAWKELQDARERVLAEIAKEESDRAVLEELEREINVIIEAGRNHTH